jgi:uncharacterized protein (DUF305 family)
VRRSQASVTQSAQPQTDQPVITGQPAGTNPELIALANQVSAAQQPEINVMKVFLVQRTEGTGNPTSSDSGHAGHGGTMQGMVDAATTTKLESLNGAEFDKLWLESMISHPQGAIEMAEAELTNGDNMDAKSLAENIVTTQEAEVGQMKQILGG